MFPNLNPFEMVVVLGVAVLLFGKRLPEVGRTLGRGIVEFKKGIRGVEEEFRAASSDISPRLDDPGHYSPAATYDPSVPKFEAPGASPVPSMEYEPQSHSDQSGHD